MKQRKRQEMDRNEMRGNTKSIGNEKTDEKEGHTKKKKEGRMMQTKQRKRNEMERKEMNGATKNKGKEKMQERRQRKKKWWE